MWRATVCGMHVPVCCYRACLNARWCFQIKVTLVMTTVRVRYHVALVDFLPAGLEPLNPALKDMLVPTGPVRRNPFRYRWYSRTHWPEHQNLRDERAEGNHNSGENGSGVVYVMLVCVVVCCSAFRSLLWSGEYEWSYTARATTKGSFVVPPAKAEEMYSPENFGRSGTDHVLVV